MTDASGKPIELEQIYGYCNNKNGYTTIVFGRASKITEKSVTLKVVQRKQSLYFNEPKVIDGTPTISINGIRLFPIREDF